MGKLIRVTGLSAIFGMLGALAAASAAAGTPAIDGRWDANLISQNGTVIPFRLDISGSGPTLKGTLYDGFSPYDGTTSATFADGKLLLSIQHYLTTITATLQDGQLAGQVVTHSRGINAQYGFKAVHHVTDSPEAKDAPSIAGSWVIPLDTPSLKDEKAFRFIVRQRGADVEAAILRVDGDTGAYSGSYKDGKWVLSHFDGARPGVIVVSLNPDGTLQILQNQDRAAQPGAVEGAGAGANSYGQDAVPNGRYATNLAAYPAGVAQPKGLARPDA